MNDTTLVALCIVGIFVVLPIAILWIRDRIAYRAPSREEDIKASKRFQERLTSPNFEAFEKHFHCDTPVPLRELYQDIQELSSSDIEVLKPNSGDAIYVCFYQPMDSESVGDPWPGCERFFAFANDGFGNELLVDPSLPDPPVLFHDHETGEFETIAPCMSEFMNWKRRPAGE